MGLMRCTAVPSQARRDISRKVSAGAAALLIAAALVVDRWGAGLDMASYEGISRRLQYPDDPLIEQPYWHANNKYWIVVHCVGIAYMLLGLNTVCDAYFTGALDVMVEKWQIKPDVAGATFMAAGGSAPELFTSLIGAVVTTNDVGFGTIVGSAVFNVLFVIGLCGWAADKPIKLTWWPLLRDCTYYILGLFLLAIFSNTDQGIVFWEAAVLFSAYICYCLLMSKSETLEVLFSNAIGVKSSADAEEKSPSKTSQVAPEPLRDGDTSEKVSLSKNADTTLRGCADADELPAPPNTDDQYEEAEEDCPKQCKVMDDEALASEEPPETKIEIPEEQQQENSEENAERKSGNGEEDGEEEEEEDPIEEMLVKPEGALNQIIWYLSLPIYVPLYYLIPKPNDRCFLCTFGISLAWIAGFSTFLVWWVEILGAVLHVPTLVMGFTLLAAGTSIPDLVSSMAVAAKGEGDMAVSSSIGSNIFDILFGLPIPWMIKIGFVEHVGNSNPGFMVKIKSPYIVFYVFLLLLMVAAVIISIHMQGWYLNRCLGMVMAGLYGLFLVIALTVEMNAPDWLII
jgi:sodium/potassium/calcium exchanger 2